MKTPTQVSFFTTNSRLGQGWRAVLCLLAAGCGWAGADRAQAQTGPNTGTNTLITPLFYDQFTQNTTNGLTTNARPVNWYLGDATTNEYTTNVMEDTYFAVTNANFGLVKTNSDTNMYFTNTFPEYNIPGLSLTIGSNDGGSNIAPVMHTFAGVNVVSAISGTSNTILQLNVDLLENTNGQTSNIFPYATTNNSGGYTNIFYTGTTNAGFYPACGPVYVFGLCNPTSVVTSKIQNDAAFQVWMYPYLEGTNNVFIVCNGTNNGFTVSNSLLLGDGQTVDPTIPTIPSDDWYPNGGLTGEPTTFSLQINYSTSTNYPVVSAWSGNTMMGSVTCSNYSSGFTLNPGAGTEATNVLIFVQAEAADLQGYGATTNAIPNLSLQNVVLGAYAPNYSIQIGKTNGHPLIFGQTSAWGKRDAIAVVGGYGDSEIAPLGSSVTGEVPPVIRGLPADMGAGTFRHALDVRVPGKARDTLTYSVGSIGNEPEDARTSWDYGLDASSAFWRSVTAKPVVLCADYYFVSCQMPQNVAGPAGNLNTSSTQPRP